MRVPAVPCSPTSSSTAHSYAVRRLPSHCCKLPSTRMAEHPLGLLAARRERERRHCPGSPRKVLLSCQERLIPDKYIGRALHKAEPHVSISAEGDSAAILPQLGVPVSGDGVPKRSSNGAAPRPGKTKVSTVNEPHLGHGGTVRAHSEGRESPRQAGDRT